MYSLNIALLMKMALDAPTIPFAKFNVFVHNAEIMLGVECCDGVIKEIKFGQYTWCIG
jgi:hypothetical protein